MISQKKNHRVLVVGTNGAGKTALLNCLSQKPFQELHEPTIGVDFVKVPLSQSEASQTQTKSTFFEELPEPTYKEPGFGLNELFSTIKQRKESNKQQIDLGLVSVKPPKPHYLEIWEMAGGQMFREMTVSYYNLAAVVVIVVDITHPDAVKESKYWINQTRIYLRRSRSNDEQLAKDSELLLVANKTDLTQATSEEIERNDQLEMLALENEIMYMSFSAKEQHRDILMVKLLEAYQKAIIKIDQRIDLVKPTVQVDADRVGGPEIVLLPAEGAINKIKQWMERAKQKLTMKLFRTEQTDTDPSGNS